MGTLEDQLKQWQKKAVAETAKAAPSAPPPSRRAQKKKPLLQTIRRELGDVPLVGFFAGGEIAHHRLYGYTGVLTVFADAA